MGPLPDLRGILRQAPEPGTRAELVEARIGQARPHDGPRERTLAYAAVVGITLGG
ncbi:MAG TPA: hypothetical protein VFT17_15445 [Propionibacteriaceae bacterium]|nr:hypothetical protein [Propionibacteriaceae bacterium]